ncbi:MAG: protein kinase [Chloroflexi bacterium]|nr:protein kinase [Chloroflexota bacterium]
MAGDQAEAAKPEDRRRHFEQADDLQALAALQDEAEAPAFVIAGRYEVLSTLGQGGMGAVYKARDPRLDRTVAIKTILPHYLANPQASRRFFREAQALGRLNHPNILTVYDSGQDGGTHYLVMELGGRDLVRVLERQGGPLPLDEALHVGLALGRALEYAHGHGVIHRDLKPANILIGSPDDSFGAPLTAATAVKVMDFGLAKVQGASALTAPSAQLGTPQYMSPEQVLGREADERADLYSLGVLLYEVCTGVRPFDGDDVRSILSQHLTLEPVPPSAFNETLPQALETLILRLLEKDPTRRPSTAADVLRVLEALARSVMADTGSSPPGSAAPQDGPAAATLPTESGAQRSVPASQFALGRLPARSALVGRGEELEWLRAQYQAVAAGADGRLVLISGEPGVGKTRLTQELGLFARLRGGAFLEGHYLRDSGGPYAPWVEAVRSGLRGLERDELAAVVDPYGADLAQILPELTGQLGPFAPGPRLGPEEQRQRLYDGIVGVLAALSQRAPLVLLLDDLQWAPGLTLLAHVARRLPESRVLLVGAFREQEFNEQSGLVREREEMNRARLFAPLALKLLTAEQTAQLVAHAFGLSVGEALGVQVHHVTHGNAFFVEEVLRGLAESGAVRPGAAGWEAADATRVSIPASLKLAVEGRVERLGDEAREMLAQAAVLGQEFALPVLAAMTRIDEDTLLDHLDRAVRARLLTELRARDEERYAFADDQVQEVLAAGISMARRRRWHVRGVGRASGAAGGGV